MSAAADQYEKAAATGHAGALGNRGTRVEKGGEEKRKEGKKRECGGDEGGGGRERKGRKGNMGGGKRKEGKVVIGWKEEDR